MIKKTDLKPHKTSLALNHPSDAQPVRIVADGAILNANEADGRFVPLVILDATTRPDIEECIRIHQFALSGDVVSYWGPIENRKDAVALILSFKRPIETTVFIEFDLTRHHGFLVEQILLSKALYIQAGRVGDKVKHNINAPKILAEIMATGFREVWSNLYLSFIAKELRNKYGMNRQQSKIKANEVIKEIQKVGLIRMHENGITIPSVTSHSKNT